MKASDLPPILDRYLAVREALGFSTRAVRPLLHEFLHFLGTILAPGPLPAHVVFTWACDDGQPRAVTTQAARLRAVRGFLTYAKATFPEIELPAHGLLTSPRRSQPYIFSPAELTALLNVAECLPTRSAFAPLTYQTLLGLLASTGVRVGEALRLQMTDVRLDADIPYLHIRQSKFRKSRLVPLHATTVMRLRMYIVHRQNQPSSNGVSTFFLTVRGTPLYYDTVQATFQSLLQRVGIVTPTGRRRPTLHSLRHTFAVQRLECWALQGVAVNDWLPHLAVYLGHRHPEDSYWYLTATPGLLTAAAEAFQQYAETGGGR
jgi:integrase/recombinase XerD